MVSTCQHFSDCDLPIAYCDAGASATWDAEYIPNVRSVSENILPNSFKYRTKEYPLELKPLFSAFGFRSLTITSLRSFLLFYLPLLEPRPPVEENDDFLHEAPEEKPVDLVTPFRNSVKQIIREVRTLIRTFFSLVFHLAGCWLGFSISLKYVLNHRMWFLVVVFGWSFEKFNDETFK